MKGKLKNNHFVGEEFFYWIIEDIDKTDGFESIRYRYIANVISTQTGKKKEIGFDYMTSIPDILLNLEH